eukprot:gnl/Spiro4/17279_TR9198_c0_g1_i1.p1 gnl/Spiro4/17279_TR9198_c0_g1~~gnl/Spiro4/17279_TR9198_c0_g1_i1.p1  ORF type:complete len:312 (+),score=62.08 gnl/Spiro4/17279_TR9198_c0_g1_i1:100-1035(+)
MQYDQKTNDPSIEQAKSEIPVFVEGKTDTLSQWKLKLFTREDPVHFHKIFGFLSLASFFYRYCIILPRQGNLGFNSDLLDWLTLACHMMLSCSSLIFHVIAKRIISKPMVIYEEYRLHAIVFTLRSVSMGVYGMLGPLTQWESCQEKFFILAILIAHHLVVDEITRRHGTEGVTAVRVSPEEQKKYSTFTRIGQQLYAFYQVAAICASLEACSASGDLGYNTIIAIQSSTFLFTLFRKGLIDSHTHAFFYGLSLVMSGYVMVCHCGFLFVLKAASLFILRTRFNINKYVLWTGLVVCTSLIPTLVSAYLSA